MRHLQLVVLALAGLIAVRIGADDFVVTVAPVGRDGPALITPVNQIVTPAGSQVDLPGVRPNAIALSPDGTQLVTAGLTHELLVVDPKTGQVIQRVPLPPDAVPSQEPVAAVILSPDKRAQLSFTGLTFSPDGSRLYLANVNGDLKVFRIAKTGTISPWFSFPLPPANAPARKAEIPAGIAISADGKKLYVAGNLSNRLFELDAATGDELRTWPVGVAPLQVVCAGHKVYVSNWGGRRPDAAAPIGPAGRGTHVRVDERSIASEGSVSVIDLAHGNIVRGNFSATPQKEIVLGPHASALALSPDGRWLIAASTGSDQLSVIDTRTDHVVETLTARQRPGDPFGAQPNALAFDASGALLYCANGSQNAIAVFQFAPRETKLIGLIPAGWFPAAIVFDARGKRICVANLKGIIPNSLRGRPGAAALGFSTLQYEGSLSLIPVPSQRELAAYTQEALTNLRYPLLFQARLPARPDRRPVPVPERVGEPSVFQHVVYIIKENRTYDQVLGDVHQGNGDPALCNFGEMVTPNQHRLVREFVLLDNTYCSGILSADGHQWSDAGIATDYVERGFGGWPRSYPSGGIGDAGRDALAYSAAGFIWNNVLAHGKSVHVFGEFSTTHKRWKNPQRTGRIGFAEAWADYTHGGGEIEYTCEPDIAALGPSLETNWCSWDLEVPDVVRAAMFLRRLKEFEGAGGLPALTIIWLPNDHTSGTRPGSPTPAAQVADNDLAFGRIVEGVSHSRFWKDTCILAIEDDPQSGWDHVSGYRTTAYVISAYTRRHAVVGTQYNQTSVLRTIELMLGLPPMNQMDATATPMFDCFTDTPDFSVFNAVASQVRLDEINLPAKKIADSQRRHDAVVSGRLPLAKPDQCDDDVLNRIVWRATMVGRPYPEWAVKQIDDED